MMMVMMMTGRVNKMSLKILVNMKSKGIAREFDLV